MISFVCSIGNVPLAAVLWNGGISFGGVCAFIFADLIILPILNIYRKYYGIRMTRLPARRRSTLTMVAAGLIVEVLFGALGLIPDERNAKVVETSITWNYTTFLNIVFLVLATVLVVRFLRTGGPAMLRMMGGDPPEPMEPARRSAPVARIRVRCTRRSEPPPRATAPSAGCRWCPWRATDRRAHRANRYSPTAA